MPATSHGPMAFLKRDHVELLLGLGVLALGLGLLVFTFSHALAIATAPGDFFRSQFPQNQSHTGPTASFRWDSTDFNATVQDTSRQGDAAISTLQWDFGDGTRLSGSTPGPHRYTNASVYQVSLIVTDANGKESRAVAQVQIVPTQTRSGESVGDPTAGLNLGFDLSGILQPVAITFLTFGMYVVLTMVGGAISRAGWNMIKPKPETIRVRLKPRDLTRAMEEDSAAMVRLPPPPA
ncbi:MAG: PKD domain-containing protein [Methanobacteriota archaeon]|nr:MAG: PKD domain-containing protein [Euryarchaeota archaeon]